jgi:hypothetical protein
MLQIKFFHKARSMAAPVTDTEKLIWSVLEAERPTIRFSSCKWVFLFSFALLLYNILFFHSKLHTESFYLFLFFCSQLHEKSLIEGNKIFLEKHKGHHKPYLSTVCTLFFVAIS